MTMKPIKFLYQAVLGAASSSVILSTLAAQDMLDPLVVTGTRTEQRLSEVPVRTEVVDREQIERTQSNTLADALEWTTGVRVENNCYNCNFHNVRLLGLQGNFTQILTDGRPTLSSLASVYGVEQIPAALIERMEIVKGGGSALYGPGAIAGVVNIIPREPLENAGVLDYQWSTFGSGPNHNLSAAVDQVSKDGSFGITAFGQASSRSPYDRNKDGFTELGQQDNLSGGFRSIWEPTDATRIVVDFLAMHEERRGGDQLDKPVTEALVAEWIQSNLYQGAIRWEQEINDVWSYELNLSANFTQRDSYYGSGGDPNAFGESESPVYQLDALTTYKATDNLALLFGMQYQYEKLEDEQPSYDRFISQEIDNFGILTQAEWDATEKWELVGGVRLDVNSELDDPVVSPRLSAKYQWLDDLALRTSYSAGFRAPQVFNEDLHISQVGGAAQVIRNADGLTEETSQSITLGMEWNPVIDAAFIPKALTSHNSSPITFEINGFFTRLDDTFDILETDNPATPEQEFTRVNAASANVYGAEFNLSWDVAQDVRLDLGFVEQRSRFDAPAGDFGSRNFERTPERYGVIELTWNAPWCEVFLGGRYTGPMEVPHYAGFIPDDRLEISPSFFTIDLSLSRKFEIKGCQTTFTAGVKNLFDDYQDDLDQGPDRDVTYAYGPRFPRMFHLGCKMDF
jgi:outer membrane receptor for ferrienterochelin and colicins